MIPHPSMKKTSNYLDGMLSERASRRFEAHLAKCEACRRKVQVLKSAGRICRSPKERLDTISQTVMAVVGQVGNLPESTDALVVGEITETSGTVLVRNGSDAQAVEVFPGCVVRLGDHVEPVDDASALIEWESGGEMRVERPTVLTLDTIDALRTQSTKPSGRTIMKTRNRKRLRWALASATVVAAGYVMALVVAPDLFKKRAVEGPYIYTLFGDDEANGKSTSSSGQTGGGVQDVAKEYYGGNMETASQERFRYGETDVKWDLPEGYFDFELDGDLDVWEDAAKKLHFSATRQTRDSDSLAHERTVDGRYWYDPARGTVSAGDLWRDKNSSELRWSFIRSSGPAIEYPSAPGRPPGDTAGEETTIYHGFHVPLQLLEEAKTSRQDVAALLKKTQEQAGKLVALSSDGKRATGNVDGSVQILNERTGEELLKLKGHKRRVASVAFSPDGKQLATASADQTVRLWDVRNGTELRKLEGQKSVYSVAFSADGSRLTTLGKDNMVKFWDTETGALVGTAERQVANAEAYDEIVENPFRDVPGHPLSTFAIDVDTASYANVRRFLNQNQRPPRNAVRIEEMINYFSYEYPAPTGEDPFSVSLEISDCPWNEAHRLVNVGLKGKEIARDQRPPSNLVFLLDVSGSMKPANKLPLVKQAMKMLVENLTGNDRVAIVVYAGASGLVLDSTLCGNKNAILEALDRLKSGGSTNGGEGIVLAYKIALENQIEGGVNRVILCTDGDFNVGVTKREDLIKLIEEEATMGTFLTVLGFGMGNLKDATLEQLADKGNGNYGYIDTIAEAQKTLVEELSGTLVTIAKDVKIQIEFNPEQVAAYRLIGYENRMLRAQDFNDDTKDAGEIGAGHRVTALYEIVPAGQPIPAPPGQGFVTPQEQPVSVPAEEETAAAPEETDDEDADVDPLRYQEFDGQSTEEAQSGEMLTAKLRYKEPDGHVSKLLTFPIKDQGLGLDQVTADYKFAAAVASFGMILRDSAYKGGSTLDSVLSLAEAGKGDDRWGYRAEFIELVKKAKAILGN